MSTTGCLLSEDQFLCPVCLDVFTEPVATPCGHNFCKSCITTHWNINFPCQCPVCKEVFYTKPELRINTLISQMAAQFKPLAPQEADIEAQYSGSGEILCDVCTGTKLEALKSCLVCLTTYCETHLEPHLTVPSLKRHQLVDPVVNLQGRMCQKHDKLLELFCKTDQTFVCMLCSVSEHKYHNVVPLKEEREEKQTEQMKMKAEIQQMIETRQLKIKQIQQSVDISNGNANRERADGVQVFTALKESVERGLAEFIETINDKQRSTEKQANGLITELENEISELMKRNNQLKQLSQSEDHLYFLQNFSSFNNVPTTKNWTDVSVYSPSYTGTFVKAVAEVEKMLSRKIKDLFEEELKRIQQYTVDVTLDPDTANPWLVLSGDNKQVHFGDVNRKLTVNPKRFSFYANVLGKQGFSSGKFYYEVQVKGKTKWDLGIVRESINRKGQITQTPLNGYWTMSLRNENEYKALSDPRVPLLLRSKPEKVGVFLDYEEGLVSFYDVDAAILIFSFTGCSFTEKLYPFFNPCNSDNGKNSTPLIISPVCNINLLQMYSRIRKTS